VYNNTILGRATQISGSLHFTRLLQLVQIFYKITTTGTNIYKITTNGTNILQDYYNWYKYFARLLQLVQIFYKITTTGTNSLMTFTAALHAMVLLK
jgi:hypothetical protein